MRARRSRFHRGLLPAPLLYISSYLEQNRHEYYERLQAVRERGEIEEWLQFFLTAVAVQADDAIVRAERLVDLRESYRAQLAGSRGRAVEVVDLLFVNPIITSQRVQVALGMTNQGAHNLIRQLEKREWLTPLGTVGRGGHSLWIARDVFNAVEEPSPPPPARSGPDQMTLGEA